MNNIKSGLTVVFTYFIVTILMTSVTCAQPSEPKKSGQEPSNSDSLAETKVTESGKVIEFKQLNLEGTVQKPSAAFLQGRKKIKFKGLTPKKSFIGEIKKSVKKYPF